jgi:hypothetical protein
MASSSPSEQEIQQRIRLACGRGVVRLWRNNTGALVDQQGRFVRFGLCKGSSDLIGLRSLEITTELVGQRTLRRRRPSWPTTPPPASTTAAGAAPRAGPPCSGTSRTWRPRSRDGAGSTYSTESRKPDVESRLYGWP